MFIVNPDERASTPNDSVAGIDSCVAQACERIVQIDSNLVAGAINNCDRSHVESAVEQIQRRYPRPSSAVL